MKRLTVLVLLLAVALGGALPAGAFIPFGMPPAGPDELVSNGPAATLLLPYFEVNVANDDGVNTVFSINNASASAGLVHVTVWSDLAVPVLGFNVYLTGFDVQTVNLRRVFKGSLPQTADAGDDPADAISPKGPISQDINFPAPDPEYPMPPPHLSASQVAGVRAALTGKASSLFGGKCAGLNRGDNIARGYVTIDDMLTHTDRFPDDPAYYTETGVRNIYWGEFFYTGVPALTGGQLVGIRANMQLPSTAPGTIADPETAVPGQYTFYGRYNGWQALDYRQALPSGFAARFFLGGLFSHGTTLVGWRDPKVAQTAFTCGNLPGWFPLDQEGLVVFDEQETAYLPPVVPVYPPPVGSDSQPFPAAAQKVKVGSAALPVPFDFGWIYFNLNTPAAGGAPEDPGAAQAWVFVVQDARGRFSLGYPATQMESAGRTMHFVPGGY